MNTLDNVELDLAFWSDPELPASKPAQKVPPLSASEEWDVQGIDEFWRSIENDFKYDPELVMYNKAESQFSSISAENIDSLYLNASTFLSPVSLAPSSPEQSFYDDMRGDQQTQGLEVTAEVSLNDQDKAAMEIIDSILAADANCFANCPPHLDKGVIKQEMPDDLIALTCKEKRSCKRRHSFESDDDPEWIPSLKGGSKRTKRSSVPIEVKKERKKDQNKTAANRYRVKKRAEQQAIEGLQNDQEKINDELKRTLEKLQMEFNVVLPLAQAAFVNDHTRMVQLQMIQLRVMKENLLG